MTASPARSAPSALRRLPLLALGAGALVAGLWAGLVRLGAVASGPGDHGPLMVGGFLGTVIALERAVAAQARWALLGPLACGAGGVLFLVGQAPLGAAAMALGSAVVLLVMGRLLWRTEWAALWKGELHLTVLSVAALGWLAGNVLLAAGRPVFDVVPFWFVFLVGTIGAERLELSRVLPRGPWTRASFVFCGALVSGGALLSLLDRDLGMRVLSGGGLGLALWLVRADVARRTVRQRGLVRFIAVALLAGYFWLAVGGGLGLVFGNPMAGPRYDALLHATFVGFVFSMIFGHAPIIVPAVLGVRVPWRPRFYAHLLLLHVSVAARLAGDLAALPWLRQAAAWANAAAIVLFLASTVLAVVLSRGAEVASIPAHTPLRSTART